MQVLNSSQFQEVSGGVSGDAVYGAAVGVAVGFFGVALAVTAPVWGTAMLLGGSIVASGLAIQQLVE